jgi:hypothetical protein
MAPSGSTVHVNVQDKCKLWCMGFKGSGILRIGVDWMCRAQALTVSMPAFLCFALLFYRFFVSILCFFFSFPLRSLGFAP